MLGLFASLAAVLLAYISQGKASLQQDAGAEKIWFLEHEGDGKITKEKDAEETKHFEDARKFRFTAVGFAIASTLLFAIGSWFGVETMITSVSPKQPTPAVVSTAPENTNEQPAVPNLGSPSAKPIEK